MKATNCIRLLNTFDKSELRLFKSYLKGLYARKKDVLNLYNFIDRYLLREDSADMSKEKVHEKLFSDKPIRKLSDTLAELTGLAEEFLIWQHIKWKDGKEKKQFDRSYMLTKIYKERKADALFHKKIEDTQRALEKQATRGMDYYLWQFLLNHEYYFFESTDQIKAKEALYRTIDYLKEWYIIAALYYMTELISRNKILNDPLELEFKFIGSPETLYAASTKTTTQVIYMAVLKLVQHPSDAAFNQVKNLMQEHHEMISLDEQEMWYLLLTNYIGRSIKEGQPYHIKDLLAIMFARLNIKLKKDEIISAPFYLNIVHVMGRLYLHHTKQPIIAFGGVLYTEELQSYLSNPALFIHKYKSYLPTTEQENTYNLALASFLFEQKKYTKALESLKQVKIIAQGFDINTRARSLKIKALVELEQDIQDECHNFRKYLNRLRQKEIISQANLLGVLNFIRLIEYFYYDKKETTFLKKELHQTKFISHKSWLLEKIDATYSLLKKE